jgi:hypothetical protein
MNKDWQMHDDHPGAEELAQRLEAYASARLSPNRKVSARIRTALIEEARMRVLATSLDRAPGGLVVRKTQLADGDRRSHSTMTTIGWSQSS